MKIRMLVQITGTRDGVDWPPTGEVVDVPNAEAVHLLSAKLAEPAGGVEPEAAAVAGTAEAAVKATKPARRKANG